MNKTLKKYILQAFPDLKPDTSMDDALPRGGPIRQKRFDINQTYDDIDELTLLAHTPIQALSPVNQKTGRVLSANTIKSMRKRNLIPNTYANPVQYMDYRIYEGLMKHTFIGSLVDSYVKYLIGTGFKPELELINPDQDEEKNKKQIEAAQYIIDDLLEIDRQLDKNTLGESDVSFQDKITQLITSMLAYNRGALIFTQEDPVIIRGIEYPDIPSHMIFADAQDLGMIEINDHTRRLANVQWNMSISSLIPVNEMIYLWNPITSAKVHNSQFYGISIISPMISASHLIRQMLSEDFPTMSRVAWAGQYVMTGKPEYNSSKKKDEEYAVLNEALTPGAITVILKDPDETRIDNIDFDPKIAEFQALLESMIKLCISTIGLPQVGFYDESATNRATMLGKIELTMSTTIDPMRKWIGQSICDQHYQRWFELMYKGKKETGLFKIKLSWGNLHIAEWYDRIEAALLADSRSPFKNREFGELIGLNNYENMLDPDGELVPGGASGNSMSMTDDKTGKQYDVKKKNYWGKNAGKSSSGGK